jgi:hypothetical protein
VHVPADLRQPGLEVLLDGDPLPSTSWGARLSIAQGAHVLEARAPGFAPQVVRITISDAARNESVTFEPFSPAPLSPAPPSPTPSASSQPVPSPVARDSGRAGPLRVLTFVAAGVGLVGIGIGTAFGVLSASKKSQADGQCHDNASGQSVCTKSGVALGAQAIDAGNVSTGAFVIGGAGAVGALVLWLVSSERTASPRSAWQLKPAVGNRSGMIELKAAW